ncbi:AMP-binding protein [Elizabethkingia argentiflava]|uniref:AMP-binding protein n=1 Tax=Elizabethkingia argenteiflava TaxID=2681556 RepID=A0A845PWJ8_9FLAO|nr:AMP-binding protein [Elizabethkingia argenteiflava]NAW51563.1 AMP-binding protein [Elizabethkingia argenteiflava]
MKKYSYIKGETMPPLLQETIGDNLRNTVANYPNHEALVSPFQNYRASYSELWRQTSQVAKAILASGIKRGDRLAIWAMNRYEWVLLQYAACRIGVILVNINPAYRSSELEYVLNQSGAVMLVSARKFKTSHYEKMVKEILPNTQLKKVIFFDKNWHKFVETGDKISEAELHAAETDLHFNDAINIQYTSGTTGFPKGVTLSHSNILNNGYFIGIRLKYTEQDSVCIPVPFFHCFGMVIGNLACTSHGATMVIPGESFNPESTLQIVEQEKCTSLYGVPTMFIAELQLPNFSQFNLSSLRTGVMAGSPCPIEIMKQVQQKMNMKDVTVCYGMTETSPVSCQTEIGVALEKQISTVGTIHEHLEIKIVNPNTGDMLPIGTAGELCTKGYSVMLGYWQNAEASVKVIDADGYMHSGDEATMDEEGYIKITGRIKDIIIRGGENISPLEVEQYLYTHEDVQDVQVIGVPDEKMGEAVMAWVKLKKESRADSQKLQAFCKGKIAQYKIPQYWKFVEAFPMTVSGKVRKVEMREISVKELGLKK